MTKNAKLTVAKTCMTANFYDAACDYPKESFEQITCRMLGSYGFPRTKNTAVYKRECRKAFKMGRRKKWETNRWWAKNGRAEMLQMRDSNAQVHGGLRELRS